MTHDCYRARVVGGGLGLQRVLRRAAGVKRGSRLVLLPPSQLQSTRTRCCCLPLHAACCRQPYVQYCRKVCSLHGPLALIGGPGPRLGWNREAQNLA